MVLSHPFTKEQTHCKLSEGLVQKILPQLSNVKVPHTHCQFAPPPFVLVKLRLRVGRSGVRMSAGRDTLLCFKKSRPALKPTQRHI